MTDQALGAVSLALERTVTRFARMVRSVGRKRGLGDPDLDELLQDVRIRIWRAVGAAEPIDSLATSYVYRTALAAAVDLLRRRRGHGGAASTPITAQVIGPAAGPAERLAATELAGQVREAIDSIPASRRVVVQLHLTGYPKPEIAVLLGYSPAKVRNLLYRGLADVRAALATRGVGREAES